MKKLELIVLLGIAGGARCQCLRRLPPAEAAQYNFGRNGGVPGLMRAATLFNREYPTKSECVNQCCEITGGAAYNYGASGGDC